MSILHPSVSELLARLRRRIRAHLVLETIAIVLVFLGVVFWLALAIDWYFEAPRGVRIAGWIVTGTVAFGMLTWWGLRRFLVPLGDVRLATLLEDHFPELGDRLTTAVEMASIEQAGVGTNAELLARLHRQAADLAENFPERAVLNQRRLGGMWLAAIALAGSVVSLAVLAPQVWSVYSSRLALANVPWPRSVQLSIEGFVRDEDGNLVRKVARNDDVELKVAALVSEGLRDPRRVRINYRWESGGRGRDELVRVGDAVSSGAAKQDYTYVFERIGDSLQFSLRGGDGGLGPLRLVVVDRPKVLSLDIAAEYPSYLRRAPVTLTAGTRVELPEGTTSTVIGTTSKPLANVWYTTSAGERVAASVAGNEFRIPLATLVADVSLQIELDDQDGVASREPFALTIAARRDELPQVAARRDGIGTGITAIAQIPIAVEATDDNRLIDAWADLAIVDGRTRHVGLADRELAATLGATPVFDLRLLRSQADGNPLDVVEGDVLNIAVAARDAFDLSGGEHIGTARPLQFEIISESELLSRLARSELNLRQTFESIADKLIVLLDDCERLDNAPTATSSAAAGPAGSTEVEQTTEELPEAAAPIDIAAAAEARALKRARLTEDARQLGTETLAVADGFNDLYRQLENNRVENQELRSRIGDRIAKPLVALGESRLTGVATQLAAATDDPATLSGPRQSMTLAVREAEQILREMQGLENYNEVIAMLREIIDKQDELDEKTKTRERDQLRSLLD